MNPNVTEKKRHPRLIDRTFPWACRHCGKLEVHESTVHHDAKMSHDGRIHEFAIPNLRVPVCRACGELVFTEKVEDQFSDALREHLKLLTPAEMRAALDRLHLTQKDAAEMLGIAEATLSRWLTDVQIQSRAMDNLLRIFFNVPDARTFLQQLHDVSNPAPPPSPIQRVAV